MKIPDLKSWKNYLQFLKKITSFLSSKINWIFLALLFFFGVYLVYFWYSFILNSNWDENKKRSYIDANGKDVVLDEKGLEKVKNNFSEREEKYKQNSENVKDIFHLK